ncbi:MAG: hypothetical protein LBC64_08065 [Fibromonadaceae bacterium]|nr:hypothetical protein [Fibromonadaceae bacterium]
MWIKQKGKNKHGEDAVTLVWHEPKITLSSPPITLTPVPITITPVPITLTPVKAKRKARKNK